MSTARRLPIFLKFKNFDNRDPDAGHIYLNGADTLRLKGPALAHFRRPVPV